jgi:prephenate dehydrogenase
MKEANFAIVGLGLIGSSLGAALRNAGAHVSGYDIDQRVRETALRLGHVERVENTLEAGVKDAAVVILAAPVPSILELLGPAGDAAPDAVVMDVGSVKQPIVNQMVLLHRPERYIGGHPIAGKESNGPGAADAALFVDRPFVLTPHARTSEATLARARATLANIGARVVVTTAEHHDRRVARTSHVPQLLSSALALGVEESDGAYAGPGLLDMTRLAMSDALLWRDILLSNREHVATELRQLASRLDSVSAALDTSDSESIMRFLQGGRDAAITLRGAQAA